MTIEKIVDKVHSGNNIDVMKRFPSNSIDFICTDNPYGLDIMGAEWDKKPPPIKLWKECYRVLKEGKALVAMSSPRLDLLIKIVSTIKEAGFIISYSMMLWAHPAGMLTAQSVSKSLKKRGCDDETISRFNGGYVGFQPRPVVEVIIHATKPYSDSKTKIEHALENQGDISWFGDCFIPYDEKYIKTKNPLIENKIKEGRPPSNLIVSGNAVNDGKKWTGGINISQAQKIYGKEMEDRVQVKRGGDRGPFSRYFDLDLWFSKTSQFFLVSKPNKAERGKGNEHESVKPVKLMSYLILMKSREGDVVLDPHSGSGTTLIAAKLLGRKYIGIERDEEHVKKSRERLKNSSNNKEIKRKVKEARSDVKYTQHTLM